MKPTQKPIAISPIRIAKNISGTSVKYPLDPMQPVAPMVTAVYVDGSLKIRALVFIDSKNTIEPTLVSEENDTVFHINYDMAEEVPKHYDAWYIEVLVKCDHSEKVTFYLVNLDPITSRGTEIHVPSA
jgi:hypothetical protein